jgi:phosphoribosylamine---glycine ligase
MNVMLLGGGGREHALAWKIRQSPLLGSLAVTHDNPGFPRDSVRVEGDPVAWAREHAIDLVVVGPDGPLAEGIADRMGEAGIPTFGPRRAAARLEWSKSFAKDFMARNRIPTATFSIHDDRESAHRAVAGPCVVKADGLALGKGVVVADSADEAHRAIDQAMGGAFGAAGSRVVIEERLSGPELSVFALCDGARHAYFPPCRDHKRRYDGDRGPNTGGMGATSPVPGVDAALLARIDREIVAPTIAGMRADGTPYQGVLYVGVMLTTDGPKVIEFNARFGDPECQPLMLLLDEDLLPLLDACAHGRLESRNLRVHPGAAACVVLVADEYPGPVDKGMPIEGDLGDTQDSVLFFAGAKRRGDAIVADGGRVLGVTSRGGDLPAALARCYERARRIQFDRCDYRRDIGGGV